MATIDELRQEPHWSYSALNTYLNICQAQFMYLADKGTPLPTVIPKLVDQTEAATMLGISLANFKRLEREGYFPFKRKMVGTSVRYRNTDLTRYILSHDDTEE